MLINWPQLIQLLVPQWLRKPKTISWLLVLTQPVRYLHAQYITYRTAALYDLGITAQTISLERYLNDRWDYIDREIYIENVLDISQFYLYNKAEAHAPVYMYNKWKHAYSYLTGQYAIQDGKVWRAVVDAPVDPPSIGNAAEWAYHKDVDTFLLNHTEGLVPYDFIIHFPTGVTWDDDELQAKMATKKLAGKRYIAVTP